MDARLQRRVQRYGWDKASASYEQFWGRQLEPAHAKLLAMAEVAPGHRVLDVACGTGLVSFPAARAVAPNGRLIGVDLSQEMVNRVSTEARRLGIANATFARMDAEALELADDSVDVALCSLGLMYVPDPLQALTEMHRVLAPGGRAVVSVWAERSRCGWAELFPIVDRRVASDVCPMFFQLGTHDALGRAMTTAGFVDVRAERIDTTLEYASAEEACGAAFEGGAVALAYSRFDETMRKEARREYAESIAAYRHGTRYEVPAAVVIARGIRQASAA